jgi:hypothetical protein
MIQPPAARSTQRLAERLRSALTGSRNPDGGWGYYAGKASRLEPTCWATLALATSSTDGAPPADALRAFLRLVRRWRHESGLLAEGGPPPNLAANGLAALVLELLPADAGAVAAAELRSAVARTYGVRLLPTVYQRQNNRLRGWPWQEGTFSWTEPTSWCLLALKRARGRLSDAERARIGEAEALLIDRSCRPGGWNVGNSNVLGRELPPQVPTTAVAVLALQDRPTLPAVGAGLAYLRQAWPREQSGFGLSLAVLALIAMRQPAGHLATALADAERRSGYLGNQCVMAMAAVALEAVDGASSMFTV